MWRAAIVVLGCLPAVGLCAEPLANTGKPIRVPFQCSEEDIQSFGLACSADEPCPVYLELSGFESAGPKSFVTGNLHTSTTTLYSILLATEDDGKSWTEAFERIRSGGLDQIQLLDLETGWVSGQLLQATPRDPFLLLTTDGGKTWRRRPLFGDSRVGAIERFWFEDRKNGYLTLDRMQSSETGARYESYESMTGGESWTLREVSSKPIRMKKMGEPSGARRLRADSATKSYLLERRQGERWAPMAAFLIEVGECRPSEAQPPEPPPEPGPEAQPVQPETPAAAPTRPRKPPSLKKPRP